MSETKTTWFIPIVIGLIAGLVSGSFGVGGGIIIVPGLVIFLHFTQRLSHGTSLMAIMPISAAGVIGFALNDSINVEYALFLGLGSILGALLGTKLLASLKNVWLSRIFSALLLLTALRLFISVPSETGAATASVTVGLATILVVVGALIGIVAGLLGVGGGLILVPILIIFFGVATPEAKGTSLVVTLVAAITGTWRNHRNLNVDTSVALRIGIAGIPTALIGAQLAQLMSSQVSAILFAVLLVLSAIRLLRTSRR